MESFKRTVSVLTSLVLIVSCLAGCGGAPAESATPAAAEAGAQPSAEAPEGATELIFWSQWSGENAAQFQTIIDEYNNGEGKDNNIFVKIERVEDENSEMMMKLMAARLAGTMPDIVHVAQMSFIAMARNELFTEPPNEVQDYIKENYFEACAGLAEYNGVYWGYPTEHQVMALFWNKQQFAEAGLSGPPRTWDELREYAKKLTVRNGNELERAGFLFAFDFSEAMMTQHISMFWGVGQELFPNENSTNIASDTGLRLNELFKGMAEDGSTNANWLPWADALNAGKGAMMMMDPWALNFNIRQKGIEGLYDQFSVAELPTPDGTPGPSMSRGFELCVASGSKNKDQAWSHLKWLNETPDIRMNTFMVEQFEFLPSHRGLDFPANWSDEIKAAYTRILEISKPQPDLLNYEEVQQAVDNMKDNILLSGADPAAEARNAETEINRIFEEEAKQ